MKTKLTQLLPIMGFVCMTQLNAQTSLRSVLSQQGFSDMQSINGTYNLNSILPGLQATITGDATWSTTTNVVPDFGIWGPGTFTINFNQSIDATVSNEGFFNPGELNSWTGNGVLQTAITSSSLVATPNSITNSSGSYLSTGGYLVDYASVTGFSNTVSGTTGTVESRLDVFVNVPEPSSAMLLGLGTIGLAAYRKRA